MTYDSEGRNIHDAQRVKASKAVHRLRYRRCKHFTPSYLREKCISVSYLYGVIFRKTYVAAAGYLLASGDSSRQIAGRFNSMPCESFAFLVMVEIRCGELQECKETDISRRESDQCITDEFRRPPSNVPFCLPRFQTTEFEDNQGSSKCEITCNFQSE